MSLCNHFDLEITMTTELTQKESVSLKKGVHKIESRLIFTYGQLQLDDVSWSHNFVKKHL